MACNNSWKKRSFRVLIAGTVVAMVISVLGTKQAFPRSFVPLSYVLQMNGTIRSQYFSPYTHMNTTPLPRIDNKTIATHLNVSMATTHSPESSILNFSASSRPPSCSPAMNIAYIKTLKTGSTTVQSIINRFGFFHNLSFIWNRESSKNGHFYHLPFTDKMAETHFLPPIHVADEDYPNYRNYNMMTVHVRYQRQAMDRYLASGTHYISIIRDPGYQWESAFNHFRFYDAIFFKPTKSNETGNITLATIFSNSTGYSNESIPTFHGCRDNTSNVNETNLKVSNCSIPELIDEYMNYPDSYRERLHYTDWEGEKGKRWAYARNNQIYDLGLDPDQHDSITAVNSWIERLEGELSLVLLNKYFDESLLVMRKLFCWTFMDIVYIAKNIRIDVGYEGIADELRNKIRKWNSADALLYAHFNRTLWRHITDYGPEFERDLRFFKDLLQTVLHNCTEEAKREYWAKDHLFGHYEREPRSNASLFCQIVSERKVDLHKRVYCRQDINRTAKACKDSTKKEKHQRIPAAKYHKTNVIKGQKPWNTTKKNTGSSVRRHTKIEYVKVHKHKRINARNVLTKPKDAVPLAF